MAQAGAILGAVARYGPSVARLVADKGIRKAVKYGAVKLATWANRRKIVGGYKKYVMPTVRKVVKKSVYRGVSRFAKRSMNMYRKYVPRTVRRWMAH